MAVGNRPLCTVNDYAQSRRGSPINEPSTLFELHIISAVAVVEASVLARLAGDRRRSSQRCIRVRFLDDTG